MRKTKTIKIDDREITLKELRVKDIRKVLETAESLEDDSFKSMETLLPLATDLKPEELENMAPSELKLLWEAFREVNADFLALTGRLGIAEALKNSIREHLSGSLAALSNGDIPEHGATASDSS